MNKSDTIKTLTHYSKWLKSEEQTMPDVFEIELALDMAVKFLGEDGWMPMSDSAKKGMVLALLFEDYSPQPVIWNNETKGYKSWITNKYVTPTHWMPLLPQPKDDE